jgi:homoserine dehydrogenase
MHQVKVAVIGLGTVGSGVVRIINEKREKIKKRYSIEIEIVDCADLDRSKYDSLLEAGYSCGCYYSDAFELLKQTQADIVVELIGGYEPARKIILEALHKGKSVVTANKEVISRSGQEIFDAASNNKADVFFEAAVGGGIPIIRPLKDMLVASDFSYVAGIVNGTTNYILTRMSREGLDFESALKKAQELGYAEPNPRADIEGDDAQAKIAILASIAFNSRVIKEKVYKEGITGITARDIGYARELGYCIKLIAYAAKKAEGIYAFVRPALIPLSHPLATVEDVYNAIYLKGDNCGELMFFGEGAGSLAAGNAVVGDIVEAARAIVNGYRGDETKCSCFESFPILEIDEFASRYYLNLKAEDKPGVLAKVASCFGNAGVSIASVIQKESLGDYAYIVFMTHTTTEGKMKKALSMIKSLDVVKAVENVMVVLDEEVL